MRDPHEVRLPEPTLDRMAAWIAERNPRQRPRSGEIRPRPRVELESRRAGRSIVEEMVSFGPGQRLFGIVTLPEPTPQAAVCVLWLNAGATHRIGMNRNYVA